MSNARLVMAWFLMLALVTPGCSPPRGDSYASSSAGDAGSSGPGVILPPEWTATPSATVPPPTPTPTITPPPGFAWATPVAVDRNYGGWVRLESKRAAIWLPPGFTAVDLGELGDVMALMMLAMTEAMGQMAGEISSAFSTPVHGQPTPTLISLEQLQESMAFDFLLAASDSDHAALFLVGDPPSDDVDLGAAVEGALDGLKGEHTIEAQHAVSGQAYPMARLTVLTTDPESGAPGRSLMYVLVRDSRAWSLTYLAPADRFGEMLPLFEKSAASFELTG